MNQTLTPFQIKLLADINAAGRLKFLSGSYLSFGPLSMLKRDINDLIENGIISKEIKRVKAGFHYATFIYFQLFSK